MPVRKTKIVHLFKTAGTLVAYESKADLTADLQLCEQITGAPPECEVTELPLVLSSGNSTSPSRQKVDYDQEFEAYWATYEPKLKKSKVYQEWRKSRGQSA